MVQHNFEKISAKALDVAAKAAIITTLVEGIPADVSLWDRHHVAKVYKLLKLLGDVEREANWARRQMNGLHEVSTIALRGKRELLYGSPPNLSPR